MPAAAVQTVVVAKPAVGTDWSYTVPGGPSGASGYAGVGLIVVCVSALLVDSGSAGNRQPTLQLLTAYGGTIGSFGINAALVVSQSARYVWGNGLPAGAAPVNSTVSPSTYPLPLGVLVPAGGLIQVVTSGLLAGDQWSDIVLTLSN